MSDLWKRPRYRWVQRAPGLNSSRYASPFFYGKGPSSEHPDGEIIKLINPDPINGHVAKYSFGKDVNYVETLTNYLVKLKAQGPLTGWEVPYFRQSFYDQLYGIADKCYYIDKDGKKAIKRFNQHTEPLKLISKSAKEGLSESEAYRRKAWEYRTYKIKDVQGMSFNEWMDLPPHLMEGILNDIRSEVAEINQQKEMIQKGGGPIPDGPTTTEELLMHRSTAIK